MTRVSTKNKHSVPVVAHVLDPSALETGQQISLELEASVVYVGVLGQPGLYRETLSQKAKTKSNNHHHNKNHSSVPWRKGMGWRLGKDVTPDRPWKASWGCTETSMVRTIQL